MAVGLEGWRNAKSSITGPDGQRGENCEDTQFVCVCPILRLILTRASLVDRYDNVLPAAAADPEGRVNLPGCVLH